jgi:hypothetical protein
MTSWVLLIGIPRLGSSRATRNIGHGSTDRRTEPLVRVIARKKVVVFRGMRAVTLREVFCPGENCPNCKSFTRQAFLAPWPILHLSRQDPEKGDQFGPRGDGQCLA